MVHFYKIKNLYIVYAYIAIILSLACTILLIFNKKPSFSTLFLLPLVFALCSYFIRNSYRFVLNKVSYTVVITSYFVRMVIIPFLVYMSGFSIELGQQERVLSDSVIASNFTVAILLMCYEFIIVSFILHHKKLSKDTFFNQKEKISSAISQKTSIIFKEVMLLMIVFVVFSLLFYPSLANYVDFFISNSKNDGYATAKGLFEMKERTPSIIYWLYKLIFNLLQIFIPLILMLFVYSKFGEKYKFLSLFFSALIILVSFVYMTPEKATSLQIGIVLFIMLIILYPKKSRLMVPWMIGLFVVFAVSGLIIKAQLSGADLEGSAMYKNILSLFNAYFSGVYNVAASLSIDEGFSLSVVFSDFFKSIPFLGYFYNGNMTSPKLFNGLLATGENYLIIPMIGQGKLYFGYLFAPLFSVISVFSSIWFESKSEESIYFLKKYIFLFAALLFAMTPVMYNFNILVAGFFNILICLFLMSIAYTRFYRNGKISYQK